MTIEEFQTAVLEQFNKIDQRFSQLEAGQQILHTEVTAIKSTMATKEDLARVESKLDNLGTEGHKDVIAMLQLLDHKLTDLQETIGKH